MKNPYKIIIALLGSLAVILFSMSLNSCNPSRALCNQLYPPVADTSTQQQLVVVHHFDTAVITVPADTSAWAQLLFECDSAGNAVIGELKSQIGLRSALQVNTSRPAVHQAVATVRCKCDSVGIVKLFTYSDTTDKHTTTITKVQQVEVPARLTWWQQFKVDYGGYAMGLILAYILIRVGWWALKTYTKIQLPFTNFL